MQINIHKAEKITMVRKTLYVRGEGDVDVIEMSIRTGNGPEYFAIYSDDATPIEICEVRDER
jgi:hypothetical protein